MVYSLDFPTFDSTQTAWSRAALAATAALGGWMRKSTGPHYMLNHLREPILADLTQQWRENLLTTELKKVRTTTPDPVLKELLTNWTTRLDMAKTGHQRAAILNAERCGRRCENSSTEGANSCTLHRGSPHGAGQDAPVRDGIHGGAPSPHG